MSSVLARRVHAIHSTPLGPMTSVWTKAGLYSLKWNSEADLTVNLNDLAPSDHAASCDLDSRLKLYFESGDPEFDSIIVDPQGWTPFTKTVYEQCRTIPTGKMLTYKELAKQSGSESASRAVGAAMSRNRVLLIIPCHRVVSAGGDLRGFSAPGGLKTKQFLLDLES